MAIASREIILPSRGILYKDPGIPEGKVTIRKLMIDELALFDGAGDGFERMSEIIKQTVTLPANFDQSKMLASDRFALLVALRNFSLPVKYPIKFKCTACGHFNTFKLDPLELPIKMAAPDFAEPVEVALPDCGITVKLRFSRVEDEEAVVKYAKRVNTQTGSEKRDHQRKHRIARCLVEINGAPAGPIPEKEAFASRLSHYEALLIAAAMEKAESGVDTTIYPECSACQAPNEQDMPFTAEFFRPTNL
jgi:hypothetical protein